MSANEKHQSASSTSDLAVDRYRPEVVAGTIVVTEEDAADPRKSLRPIPSLHPNDPLNWSTLEKYSTFLTISAFTFLATVSASNFTVATVPLAKYFKESTTRIGYLTCFNVLLLGIGNLLWAPLISVVRKRPVYLGVIVLLAA